MRNQVFRQSSRDADPQMLPEATDAIGLQEINEYAVETDSVDVDYAVVDIVWCELLVSAEWTGEERFCLNKYLWVEITVPEAVSWQAEFLNEGF
jgi:hypothetical protein